MSGTEATHANVDGSMIKSSQKEILKFEDHVNFTFKKASEKLYIFLNVKLT